MTRAEKLAQLGSFWAFEVVGDGRASTRPRWRRWPSDGIGADHPAGRLHQPAPDRGGRDRQRDPALPRRGDAARDPGDRPRGVPARPHRLGGAVLPAVDRRGGELRSGRRRGDGRDDPATDAADRRAPRARPRSSTSAATRAGAASRRPTARTRTSRPSSAAPTSRRSRVPTSPTGVLATAKHMVGHGLAEGGLNQAPAHIGPRELRDEQLFPFEAAVRHAGIGERHAGLLRRGRRARATRRPSC